MTNRDSEEVGCKVRRERNEDEFRLDGREKFRESTHDQSDSSQSPRASSGTNRRIRCLAAEEEEEQEVE